VEPLSLVGAVRALLVRFGRQTGDKLAAAASKTKALQSWRRARPDSGSSQRALLGGVEAEPNHPDQQLVLQTQLAEFLSGHELFAAALQRVIDEAEQAERQICAAGAGVVVRRSAACGAGTRSGET
jgi:hypothetical protein